MTFIITICVVVLLLAIITMIDNQIEDTLEEVEAKQKAIAAKLEVMEADYKTIETMADRLIRAAQERQNALLEPPKETAERVYIPPRVERTMRRYVEQLRRVKKWEHYAAHAKKARTRKKYRNRLREYYSREPAFMPAGIDSGIATTAGGWWLRTPPGPGAAAYNTPPSKMGGFL